MTHLWLSYLGAAALTDEPQDIWCRRKSEHTAVKLERMAPSAPTLGRCCACKKHGVYRGIINYSIGIPMAVNANKPRAPTIAQHLQNIAIIKNLDLQQWGERSFSWWLCGTYETGLYTQTGTK